MMTKHDHRLCLFVLISAFQLFLVTGIAKADLRKLETDTNLRGVYFLPTPSIGKVFVYPVFVAGEADFRGPHGLSHYLEHIMYWHADKVNTQPYHARQGNAWVNGYVTAYYNSGTRSELDDMFSFSRRLLNKPTLDSEFMLKERDVVVREYDYRVSESPDRQAWDIVWPLLLPENPASRSVIGTPKSIKSLTLDHAIQFHKQYYSPANMVLLVTGDLQDIDVKRKVEKTFGELPAGEINNQTWRKFVQSGAIAKTIPFKSRYVAFPAIAQAAVGNWKGNGNKLAALSTLSLTQAILNSSLDGGLAKPLRLNEFVFSDYNSGVYQLIEGQFQFYFQGRLDKEVSYEEGKSAFENALQHIATMGIPQKSLDRVRSRLIRQIDRRSDEPVFVLSQAAEDLTNGVMPQNTATRIEALRNVTLADVNQLMVAIANAQRTVTVLMRPEEK